MVDAGVIFVYHKLVNGTENGIFLWVHYFIFCHFVCHRRKGLLERSVPLSSSVLQACLPCDGHRRSLISTCRSESSGLSFANPLSCSCVFMESFWPHFPSKPLSPVAAHMHTAHTSLASMLWRNSAITPGCSITLYRCASLNAVCTACIFELCSMPQADEYAMLLVLCLSFAAL